MASQISRMVKQFGADFATEQRLTAAFAQVRFQMEEMFVTSPAAVALVPVRFLRSFRRLGFPGCWTIL